MRKTITSTQRVEEGWTRTGKDQKENQLVQAGRKRGGLQKKYQKEIKQQGFKIKVVEKAGIAVKRLLQRPDPFKPRQCEREDCLVCRTDRKGLCDRESVTYEVKCTKCNNVYVGETSRRAYTRRTRRKEHTKSLSNKEERNIRNIVRRNTAVKYRNFKWMLPVFTRTTRCWDKYLRVLKLTM